MITLFRQSRAFLLGLLLLVPIILMTAVGPLALPDPFAINVQGAFEKPSFQHLLGTDALGRDVLARLCYGGRYSLFISLTALAASLAIGISAGLLAGWFGGLVDKIFNRLLDTLMCVPDIMLALLLVLFLGRGITGITIALAITGVVYISRLVRAEVHLLRSRGFVEAAVLYGIPGHRILLFHLLPNILGPVLAYSAVLLGSNILGESALSFLGLGIQPPAPSWGAMLFESRTYVISYPWLALAPGVTIFLTVFGFNLLAEGLRYYLNPLVRGNSITSGGSRCGRKVIRS